LEKFITSQIKTMAMKKTLHARPPKERNQMELQMLSPQSRKTWENLLRDTLHSISDLQLVYLDHPAEMVAKRQW
jgi:hypothetical protein